MHCHVTVVELCSLAWDVAAYFVYTVFQKKTGSFVISSCLCTDSYELHENFQQYIGGVACCEYGINVCDSLTILC